MPTSQSSPDIYDVLIVGAGPAGISASLRAIENKLNYITIERDEVGGTVAKFPRQKVVTTTPLEFPTYGKLNKTELSKEHLLAFWDMVLNRVEFNVCADSMVNDIEKHADRHPLRSRPRLNDIAHAPLSWQSAGPAIQRNSGRMESISQR